MRNEQNVRQAAASNADLEQLATLLSKGKVSVIANLLTVLDASGNVVKVEDLPLAFLALAYEGRTESIRELERALELRLAAQAQAHELAAVAAARGYAQLLKQYLEMVKLDPAVMTERLASDLKVISRVTGIGAPQQLDEKVFTAIAGLDFVNVVPSAKSYAAGRGAVPSAAVAQLLYLAVITPDKTGSLDRVKRLHGILKIQPALGEGAEAQTLEEYVRESIKATGQELPNKHPLYEQLELAGNPEEFRRRMSGQFALLSGSEGYNPKNVGGALNFLKVAADKGIALPEDVSGKLLHHLVMALVRKGSEYTTLHRVRDVLKRLEGQGVYTVDKGAFQAAITEGLKLLADESSGAKGKSLFSIKNRGGFLIGLAKGLDVELTGQEARQYLVKIRY
ncbi:hypothetical protein HYV83_01545 [Candidatus Woesearchaeota archaeon]|nr:hypothetical protein [Candidatus Woesearchaeota archaeon]